MHEHDKLFFPVIPNIARDTIDVRMEMTKSLNVHEELHGTRRPVLVLGLIKLTVNRKNWVIQQQHRLKACSSCVWFRERFSQFGLKKQNKTKTSFVSLLFSFRRHNVEQKSRRRFKSIGHEFSNGCFAHKQQRRHEWSSDRMSTDWNLHRSRSEWMQRLLSMWQRNSNAFKLSRSKIVRYRQTRMQRLRTRHLWIASYESRR